MHSKLIAILGGMACTGTIFPAQLGLYEFKGTGDSDQRNTVTTQPADAQFGPFLRIGVAKFDTDQVFSTKGWSTIDQIELGKYVSFSLTADSGNFINLAGTTDLTFASQRSPSGPATGMVSLFVNSAALAAETLAFSLPAANRLDRFTLDFSDQSQAQKLEFRFYGYRAGSGQGTLRFDDVALGGEIVPEPSTLLAGGLLVGALAWTERKRLHAWIKPIPHR